MNRKTFKSITGISLTIALLFPITVLADVTEISPVLSQQEDIPEIPDAYEDDMVMTAYEDDMTGGSGGSADISEDVAEFDGTAGKKIGLNNTRLKLVKGEKIKLKLVGVGKNAEVKWSAGKKGIVKLKNDNKRECKVTAKKTGTVYVKAKYNGRVYKCKITVVSAPQKTIRFGGKKYRLSYYDEFNTFNKKRWAYCPEQERQDIGGQWRNSCSTVHNGKFVITCMLDDDGTPISGAIRSTKDYEQTFGLYHIRFKMEKANALWYAFWLLSDGMEDDSTVGNGATDGAELDMIELVPKPKEMCMSVHWDGYGKHLKSYCETKHVDDSFFDGYHDLWYLWDKDGYRFYLDGKKIKNKVFDFNGKKHGDGTCAVPCDLIISAEFGKWGGKLKRSQLPAHLYVDYVRVYNEAP